MEDKKLTITEKIELMDNNEYDKIILLRKITELFLKDNKNKIILPVNVLNDLNINTIFDEINYTITLYGENVLKDLIINPIKNVTILKSRQNNIKKLIKRDIMYNNIQKRLENIKSIENNILWFWNEITEDLQSLYDMVYFKFPYVDEILNNNEIIMNILNVYKIFISPIFTICIPIFSLIIPYLYYIICNQSLSIKTFINSIYNSISFFTSLVSYILSKSSTQTKYLSIFMTLIYIFMYVQSGYYSLQ